MSDVYFDIDLLAWREKVNGEWRDVEKQETNNFVPSGTVIVDHCNPWVLCKIDGKYVSVKVPVEIVNS